MPSDSSGNFICPNCGEDVAQGSLSCPHCGSDEETGWSQEAEYDDLDLPTGYRDEDLVDEGWVAPSTFSKDTLWRTVAVVLLLVMLILVLLNAF